MVSRILKLRFYHETKFVYLFSCTVIVNNNIQFREKKSMKTCGEPIIIHLIKKKFPENLQLG